jgi:regulator of chromosome condensation RCC1
MSEAGQCEVNRWHDIVAIAAGAAHTVGLRADGGVVATGSNSHGQLEVGA